MSVSTLGGVLLLALFLVIGFVLGRMTKEGQQPLPTQDQLSAMAEAFKAWQELGDAIAGWKAAVYGASGVVLGALSGLAADFITTGDMSAGQIGRAAGVLGGVILCTVVIIAVVEHFRLVERFFKKRPDSVGKAEDTSAATEASG